MKTTNSTPKPTNPNTVTWRARTAHTNQLLLLLLLMLPVAMHAQFAFLTNNGALTITGYTGSGGDVIIPDSTNGLPVTSIGDYAFRFESSVTSVTIPNGVTNIGREAFIQCSSLTSITIPESLVNIGSGAFYVCESLTGVTIPNSVTNIGKTAFGWCTSLSTITVDAFNSFYSSVDGVLFNKSQSTLIQCPGAKSGSYIIPYGTITIGENALAYCYSLTSVMIPSSVSSIEYRAFYYCFSLPSITIPNTVTNIGELAFGECSSLSAITVDALNPFYSSADGILFNKSQTTLVTYPAGKTGSYTIPNSVTNIGNNAFHCCTGLTAVMIPNSVSSIGYQAFFQCSNLLGITIPNSVTKIASATFGYCTNLTSATMGTCLASISDLAFAGCTSLKGVYFRGNAPSIIPIGPGIGVFLGVTDVTVYYLPGTTGWGPVFDGRPTALWNAQIQTGAASFGVRTNRFGFTITGTTNIPIVVAACTNPYSPVWVALTNCNLTNGLFYFSDAQWTNYPARFYRLRWP